MVSRTAELGANWNLYGIEISSTVHNIFNQGSGFPGILNDDGFGFISNSASGSRLFAHFGVVLCFGM
jgi:cold shock CspA family protein